MFDKLNNASRLLLYLADELSAADRARVELMLGTDPALRAELQELDGAIGLFDSGMAHLDAVPLQGESAALNRIGSAMRGRLAGRSIATFVKPAEMAHVHRFPAWIYPSAAAAAVLVACVIWFARPTSKSFVQGPNPHPTDIIPPMPSPFDKFTAEQEMANSFGADNPNLRPKSIASLEAAEEQIAELTNGGSDPAGSFFAIPDANE